MPRKVFTAGEVLAAADVNDFLMDQTIQVFAGTAARGSAIPTPLEGMYVHLNDTDALQYFDGSDWVPAASGKIVQVVSAVKTDVFSASVAAAGISAAAMSATITPTSASNKVLVMVSASLGSTGDSTTLTVFKGASVINEITGDAAGSRRRVSTSTYSDGTGRAAGSGSVVYLDSPATTSATTYDIRLGHGSTVTQTVFLNRTFNDDGVTADSRQASTITLIEVSA